MKFKVGDTVYSICYGLGKVIEPNYTFGDEPELTVKVYFELGPRWYSQDGKFSKGDVNPTLLTLEEARAKGYDVPKQKIVKEKTLYINLYKEPYSSYLHTNKDSAELSASKNIEDILVTAYPVTIKCKVEE